MTPEQFPVEVEGIGTFLFRRRTVRLERALHALYVQETGGVENPTFWLETSAMFEATMRTLCVKAPEGFAHDAMDPHAKDYLPTLTKILGALSAREGAFRGQPPAGSAAQG